MVTNTETHILDVTFTHGVVLRVHPPVGVIPGDVHPDMAIRVEVNVLLECLHSGMRTHAINDGDGERLKCNPLVL